MRHARHHRQHKHHQCGGVERRGFCQQLRFDLVANVVAIADAGHDDRRGGCQQQRGNLCHQTITDGQQNILLKRLTGRQIVFEDADQNAAQHVDQQDHDPGYGVTAHKLRRAVHRAVEIRLVGDIFAPLTCLFLIDQSGVEIGVDRHLLARQRIKGKARRDFRNTLCAFGDHHEVDDHQDHKHHEANNKVAADHHVTERLNHLTGGTDAVVAVEQHHAR